MVTLQKYARLHGAFLVLHQGVDLRLHDLRVARDAPVVVSIESNRPGARDAAMEHELTALLLLPPG